MAYEDDEFDDECDFEVNKKLCFCKLPARPRVTFPNVYHEDAETAKQRKVPDSVGSVSETSRHCRELCGTTVSSSLSCFFSRCCCAILRVSTRSLSCSGLQGFPSVERAHRRRRGPTDWPPFVFRRRYSCITPHISNA